MRRYLDFSNVVNSCVMKPDIDEISFHVGMYVFRLQVLLQPDLVIMVGRNDGAIDPIKSVAVSSLELIKC